jgi:hypothetical protein
LARLNAPGLRNPLLFLALLMLIAGAVLRIRQQPLSWYFIVAAFLVYIFARFFIKR